MKIDFDKFKKYLVESEVISEKELEDISQKKSEKRQEIEKELIEENYITEENLAVLKANIAGIPFVNLEDRNVPLDVLRTIPEHIARLNNIVAYRREGSDLEVAMLDPEDLAAIDFVEKSTELRVLPRMTTREGISHVLSQYQESLEAEFEEILKGENQGIKELRKEDGEKDKDNLEEAAKEVSVIKIVDTLIKHAILQNASDIHIEPEEKDIIVRYRIDGILHDAMVLPANVSTGIVARIKILANLKIDERRLPQDGRFKIETNNYKYSLRVSVLPVTHGEKIVMRLLPETGRALDLEEIGLAGISLERVRDNLKKTSGTILVTGPTGSGKTTTLYSLLQILNTPEVNISTIEDPVEYEISRISQTQVNTKIGLTFASGLRSLVRQDPDVIMVGEIRDSETAHLATNASLTGHQVLSTLHTTDAAGAVSRLTDMGVEPFLISSTLNIVIGQRLVRKIATEKESYRLNKEEVKSLSKFCDTEKVTKLLRERKIINEEEGLTDIDFYRPKKSKEAPTGYKGRSGIYEVLPVTEAVRDLIVKKAGSSKIKERAQKEGMITMVEDGIIKAAQGMTSIEEVLRVVIE